MERRKFSTSLVKAIIYTIMKSTKQPQKIEKKIRSQFTSSHIKTMGSRLKSEEKVKVLKESPLKFSKFGSKMHEIVRKLHASILDDGSDPTDPLVSGLAMSLVSLNTVYPFRLATIVTVSSDSTGKVPFSFPADPSSSGENFPEYSTIISLFNQVRVRSFEVTFAPMYKSTSNNTPPFVVAGSLTTLGVPTSYTAIVENADSQLYPWQSWDTPPYRHKIRYKPKPVWADSITPDPGDNIGCPGSIVGYADGLPPSVDVLRVMVVGIYEFRSRT